MITFDLLGRHQCVPLADCNYSLWRLGAGPLVVLLHGWPVTSWHWRAIAPRLADAGYEVCCIDLKGLGESIPAFGSFSKVDIAKEILEVLRICYPQVDSFSVVGHDWGGSVAVAMASISNNVCGLVVEEEILPGVQVSLPAPGRFHYPTWHGGFHRSKPLAEKMIQASLQEYFDFFIKLRHSQESLSKELRKHYLSAYSSVERLPQFLEYYRTIEIDSAFFSELSKKSLTIPVLGIGGKYAMGSGVFESLKDFASHSEFSLFEKSGHYPAEEEPEVFVELVVSFLGRIH